jgi:hypothetical protein
MKKLVSGLMSLSLMCLMSAGALADHYKDLKENITISNTVYVNGVKVKPGRYKVRYDAATHDMKLERNGDVVVTAKASVVVNTDKFEQDALLTRGSEDSMQLTGIRLGGQREEIQLDAVITSVPPVSDETVDLWFLEFYE